MIRRSVLYTGAALAFAVSAGIYVLFWLVIQHQPFHVGIRELRFFDLRVYRGAGWRVLHDRPLYLRPIRRNLGFTYPPFAALILTPLAMLSLAHDKVYVIMLNGIGLVWMLRMALSLRRPAAVGGAPLGKTRASAWALAAVAAAAALWLEPITVTLGYGQIDILITALIIFDLARPDGARGKGIGIGLAAAIKLTPLLFIVYLACSRRMRAALVAGLTFAGSIALSFILVPGDASMYWGGLVFKSSRVGSALDPGNQSLRAALARLVAERHPGVFALAAMVLVGAIGVLLAARASRHGDEATGFALCAVATLLTSPVSWTHHWTLVAPGLFLLCVLAYEQRRPALALIAGAALAVGYAYLPERVPLGGPALGGLHTLIQDPYVLAGLVALALPAAQLLRPRTKTGDAKRIWRRRVVSVAADVNA